MANLRDKIWFTAHARMQAEIRFRRYDRVSHLALTYMSFWMVVAWIFSAELAKNLPNFEKLVVTISILILITSIVMYGFNFSKRADQFRDCYLALQCLYDHFDALPDAASQYHKILAGYPNHSEYDYQDFVLSKTFLQKSKLVSDGTEVRFTWLMLLLKIGRIVIFWGILVLAPQIGITTIFIKYLF